MSYKRLKIAVYLVLLTTIQAILGGCIYQGSPIVEVIIENQTNQILSIYIDDDKIGDVQPGEQIMQSGSGDEGEWHIKAKNSQGKTVFSETFTYDPDDEYHLKKIESGVYKAVIPPLLTNSN